jgi:hypothetical protein
VTINNGATTTIRHTDASGRLVHFEQTGGNDKRAADGSHSGRQDRDRPSTLGYDDGCRATGRIIDDPREYLADDLFGDDAFFG